MCRFSYLSYSLCGTALSPCYGPPSLPPFLAWQLEALILISLSLSLSLSLSPRTMSPRHNSSHKSARRTDQVGTRRQRRRPFNNIKQCVSSPPSPLPSEFQLPLLPPPPLTDELLVLSDASRGALSARPFPPRQSISKPHLLQR